MNPGERVGAAEYPSEDSDVPWLLFFGLCLLVGGIGV